MDYSMSFSPVAFDIAYPVPQAGKLPVRPTGRDIQLHLLTELEICDLLKSILLFTTFNVQFPMPNNSSLLINGQLTINH